MDDDTDYNRLAEAIEEFATRLESRTAYTFSQFMRAASGAARPHLVEKEAGYLNFLGQAALKAVCTPTDEAAAEEAALRRSIVRRLRLYAISARQTAQNMERTDTA